MWYFLGTVASLDECRCVLVFVFAMVPDWMTLAAALAQAAPRARRWSRATNGRWTDHIFANANKDMTWHEASATWSHIDWLHHVGVVTTMAALGGIVAMRRRADRGCVLFFCLKKVWKRKWKWALPTTPSLLYWTQRQQNHQKAKFSQKATMYKKYLWKIRKMHGIQGNCNKKNYSHCPLNMTMF